MLKRLHQHVARGLLVAALAALALLLEQGKVLQRIDHLVYDYLLIWQQNQASEQVVIAAIDDESLQVLGRWPWSRRIQAQLLDRLTEWQAKAVGFDVLFAEPELSDPGADEDFAQAMEKNGKTVLAVAPSQPSRGSQITELLPVPELAASAAGLGHVDIEIDADGLCRSFYLYGGIGNPHWRNFSLSLMHAAGQAVPDYAVSPTPDHEGQGWLRTGRFYVPFDSRPSAVRTIPIHRLLTDDQAAIQVTNRYVLVGSTATGLGDVVSTPVSYDHHRMPGVELNAHILSGLLTGNLTSDIDSRWQTLLTVALVVAGATAIISTSFPVGVLLLFAGLIATLAISAALMLGWQLWFGPAAAMAPLVISFPLWAAWSLLRERRISQSLAVQVRHQSLHHAATNLPNQHLLIERLKALKLDPGEHVALMVVHVDWSHSIVGMSGQAAMETLMQAIATRLRATVRGDDLLAHLSGDEFGLLIERFGNVETANRVAVDVLETLRQPIDVDGASITLVPRMGISLWPGFSQDAPALLRDAYIAMFQARIENATTPCVYSEEIAREVEAQSQLERALLSALERNEFEVYYQPQVRTSDGHLIGVEALLRWNNPQLGLVYPGAFIPVAEHNGLIHQIGSWVLHTACRQTAEWNKLGKGSLSLAVNLSPLQFEKGDLLGEVRGALKESGLQPNALELEITESALMQNLQGAVNIMSTLKALGVKLAIDDFGTGYSSLSHLRHFPLDRIKIDQSFTRGINDSEDVREITLAIIGMAKRLKLSVIAEGVETESQVAFFEEHGCDDLQGFLFGQPVPAKEIERLLGKQH